MGYGKSTLVSMVCASVFTFASSARADLESFTDCTRNKARDILAIVKTTVGLQQQSQMDAMLESTYYMCDWQDQQFVARHTAVAKGIATVQVREMAKRMFPESWEKFPVSIDALNKKK